MIRQGFEHLAATHADLWRCACSGMLPWASSDASGKAVHMVSGRGPGWIDAMLALAALAYGVGVSAPLFTVEKLLIFSETVSIFSALQQLAAEGYVFLFMAVLIFSVLLPMAKLALLMRMRWGRAPMPAVWLDWLERLAKWSMLDVFVVALLVVSVKLRFIAQVQTHYGLYAFAGSVLLTMAVAASLRRNLDRTARGAEA